VGRLTAGPEVAEEERPLQVPHVDGAMDDALGEAYKGGSVEGVFFPFLPKGYFYSGAQILHVLGVGGNEHQIFLGFMGVGALGEHAGLHDVIEGELPYGAGHQLPEVRPAGKERAALRRLHGMLAENFIIYQVFVFLHGHVIYRLS
jgi:hypothetical protein